jgi:hypothetical protein
VKETISHRRKKNGNRSRRKYFRRGPQMGGGTWRTRKRGSGWKKHGDHPSLLWRISLENNCRARKRKTIHIEIDRKGDWSIK